MNQFFLGLLNRALVSSILILAVMIVRVCIKKAPKWIMCVLWGLVAVKLILPFQIESIFSLIPASKPIPTDIEFQAVPQIQSGIPVINQVVNPVLESGLTPEVGASVNPMQIVLFAASVIWLVGVIAMCLSMGISYGLIRRRVSASKNVFENVSVCDEISSPFILGVIRPKIYLPSGMNKDTMECVIAHEKAHLKRWDHIWKPLGFLILTVYWFHPLCWIAYVLLCKDIEFACDEKVTKNRDKEWKAAYCQALLDCNIKRRIIVACPVAFGEGSVKARVRSVLHYKKPAFWVVVLAVVLSFGVAVCFMTTSKSDVNETKSNVSAETETEGEKYPETMQESKEPISQKELTMQELVRMVTLASWEQALKEKGISFWDPYVNVLEDAEFHKDSLTGIRQASLMYDGSSYELQVYYYPEDTAEQLGYAAGDLSDVLLLDQTTGDAILLFSCEERYVVSTEIESFLQKEYELPKELFAGNSCAALEGEVTCSDYHVDLFLNFSGCLFEHSQYEKPMHGDYVTGAWYSLGGVGICKESDYEIWGTFENGYLVSYEYIDNHMESEFVQAFHTEEASGCLYRYNMDLFTATDAEFLEDEIPLESEYWVTFFTKGQGEPLYMKFFNCQYYSKEEAIQSALASMN